MGTSIVISFGSESALNSSGWCCMGVASRNAIVEASRKKLKIHGIFLHCSMSYNVCRKMFVLSTVLGVLRLDNINTMPAMCLPGSYPNLMTLGRSLL